MSVGSRLRGSMGALRWWRLLALVGASLLAALASDWLRTERVIFPAPLPQFTRVPAGR